MARAATGILLAFAAYASWGLLSPVGKHLLATEATMGLNAVRFTIAAALVLAAIGPAAVRASFVLLGDGRLWWANLLANVSLTLFLYSLTMLPLATYATLGFFTAPLWTAALAHRFLGERAGPWFLPACAAMMAGGWLTLFGMAGPPPGFDVLGMALAVGSGLLWAVYSVELRKAAPSLPLRPLMGASFVMAALYFVALALVVEGPPNFLHRDAAGWGWMAFYVAIPTLASFVLFNAALQRAGAGPVNLLVGAELAFTALFAWLLFGDTLDPAQGIGLALVLGSVTAYLWARTRSFSRSAPQGPL